MRILFDIAHPAHVHMFKYIIKGLERDGHETTIVARQKDVTCKLLDNYDLPYACVGKAGHKSRLGQLLELITRDFAIIKIARSFKPDLIVTRNPAGVQAARYLRIPGIFDTDNGTSAGIHYKAAAPFATVITTPDCLKENLGKKHVKYAGYKQSAYLHPDHFQPDSRVLDLLGVEPNEPFFIVRFVAMSASHDKGESGFPAKAKQKAITKLQEHGRVFISSEDPLPEHLKSLKINIPPELMHSAIYYARLCIGDSGTMPAEAAVIGTPSLWVHSFAGKLELLEEMEHRYGLTWGFQPTDTQAFFEKLDAILAQPDFKKTIQSGHNRMLKDKVNVTKWFIDYIEKAF